MPHYTPHNRPVYNRPPLFPTPLTPEEIVGLALMPLFTSHYKACMNCNPDDFDKATKKFDQVVRDDIGAAYTRLVKYGFHPVGIDPHGNIRWAMVADSRPDRDEWLALTDRVYSKAEIEDIRRQCRSGMGRLSTGLGMPFTIDAQDLVEIEI